MSEFRRDPIIGRWVIISTDRSRRPSDFKKEVSDNLNKPCPFCVGNEGMTPRAIITYKNLLAAKKTGDWSLRVVANKYPALAIEGSLNRKGEGMYDKMNGIGAHEVIIETPDHNKEIPDMADKNVQDIFWAAKDRITDLKRDQRFEYILVLKNRGSAAGATLAHPHSQLIATPIVPKRVKEEISGAKSYFEQKERCVFCDIVTEEMSSIKRIVAENEDFLAFCPYASRSPFETWVIPKAHFSHFEYINENQVVSLGSIMKGLLKKMDNVLDTPPYNYIIHNSPLKDAELPHYHWHIEIMPKLVQVAGFEWGSGFYINPTPPEEAAKFLRESE
ncbi:MAG: galactose-1-phosphate uridylyltransferase [Elusimicrobia bacterium]|nr:galactose-1-phosphate uridylyltransferase [Candidatus Liberimonas magnetica]